MSGPSKIEWTEQTWNPIVGCSIVSPGCTHCYAMRQAYRIEAMTAELSHRGRGGAPHYNGTTKQVNGSRVWTGKVALAPADSLTAPLRRRKPTTYFVNSMGDLFHEAVRDEWIDQVFAAMALAPQHTFQVLTKRAERMRSYVERLGRNAGRDRANELPAHWQVCLAEAVPAGKWPISRSDAARRLGVAMKIDGDQPTPAWPLPNVWLGVSAEDQRRADERIPDLLATPAAVRFVSAEPLLGPIDLRNHRVCDQCGNTPFKLFSGDPLCPQPMPVHNSFQCPLHWWPSDGCDGALKSGIDWIIVGGESGPGARPMHPDWARSIRDQCAAAGVPFFFKQWGAFEDCGPAWGIAAGSAADLDGCVFVAEDGRISIAQETAPYDAQAMRRVGKKAAGRLLDGIEHNGMPGRG